MAKLILVGDKAHVELTSDPEDSQTIATCFLHPAVRKASGKFCTWTERYDTLDDAANYAADHADRG
jgi:hypothetical protein